MKLKITDNIQSFLRSVCEDGQLEEEVKQLAKEYLDQESVEWDVLKKLKAAVNARQRHHTMDPNCNNNNNNNSDNNNDFSLHQICRGSALALSSPPPPTSTKSPELQAHLERLRLKLEQDRYDAMVSEVCVRERQAKEATEWSVVPFKQQIGLGIHIVAMMGAFYLFGHYAGVAFTSNRTYHPVFGMGFMIFALLLETVLYVIRTTTTPTLRKGVFANLSHRKHQRLLDHWNNKKKNTGGGDDDDRIAEENMKSRGKRKDD